MNTLLMDVGNSRLKWGLYGGALLHDTAWVELRTLTRQGLPALAAQWPDDVDAVVACNVAGESVAELLSAGIRSRYGLEPRFVRSAHSACGVTSGYTEPQRLGVDRWVAMIGARASSDQACLIVDAGTAITIDALGANGRHLGGQILPGFQMMLAALAAKTSDLPSIQNSVSHSMKDTGLLANNSSAAMVRGVVGAALGAVERVLRALRADGHDPDLLLTGGDAECIYRSLDEAAELRPNLVLEGLACLAERGG